MAVANWQTKKLSEVCKIIKGKNPILHATRKEKYLPYLSAKFLRNTNVAEYASVADKKSILVDSDEIIIICDGSNSGETFFGFKGIISSTMGKIVHNNDIATKYLNFFLLLVIEYLKSEKTGTAIPHLDIKRLLNLDILLPSLTEQRRIVKILDEIFKKIAKAKENTKKNLQNSKELFESYLQSIFINRGGGWEEKQLGDFLKLEYGKPLDKKYRKENGKFPVYGANGEKNRSDKFFYDKPTIIVGRKGSAGELNLTENKFWPLDVTYFVVFDEDKYDLKFIYFLLSTLKLTKLAKGVKPGINRNDVYSISVFTPNVKEQKSIVAKLDALSAQTKKLEEIYKQKLADLEELKKSILKKAFSGEL